MMAMAGLLLLLFLSPPLLHDRLGALRFLSYPELRPPVRSSLPDLEDGASSPGFTARRKSIAARAARVGGSALRRERKSHTSWGRIKVWKEHARSYIRESEKEKERESR